MEEELVLETNTEDNCTVIKVPGNCFSGYGIVRIPI
jgi:hypothetical protein